MEIDGLVGERNHPVLQVSNHPALRAPLQRRGMTTPPCEGNNQASYSSPPKCVQLLGRIPLPRRDARRAGWFLLSRRAGWSRTAQLPGSIPLPRRGDRRAGWFLLPRRAGWSRTAKLPRSIPLPRRGARRPGWSSPTPIFPTTTPNISTLCL